MVRLRAVSVALPRDLVNSFSLSPPYPCVRMLLPSGAIRIQSVMIQGNVRGTCKNRSQVVSALKAIAYNNVPLRQLRL